MRTGTTLILIGLFLMLLSCAGIFSTNILHKIDVYFDPQTHATAMWIDANPEMAVTLFAGIVVGFLGVITGLLSALAIILSRS